MASTLSVKHGSETKRGPSNELWSDCPWMEIDAGTVDGVAWYDDFTTFGTLTAGGTLSTGRWTAVADTGGTVTALLTDPKGVIAMTTDTTDEDEIYLMSGNNLFGTAVIPSTGGGNLWFEARVKVSTVTDGQLGFFIGLTEEAIVADQIVDATGALASKDCIGFHVAAASGSACNWVYRKAGQTQQTALASAATLVADTYVKLGFKFLASNNSTKRIICYVDGVEKTTYITAANIAASTFPSGEEMLVSCLMKSMTAAAKTVSLDWVRFAQLG